MRCPACDNVIPTDSRYCAYCGEAQPPGVAKDPEPVALCGVTAVLRLLAAAGI